MPAVAWILIALAAVGILDSLYFVLVTYRVIPPDPRWLPNVCRMDEGTCARIVHTREARSLGLPNAVYGLAWFALVLAAAVAWIAAGSLPFRGALLAISAFTVAFSAYLFHALVRRMKVACPLCFLGHALNAAILVALLSA